MEFGPERGAVGRAWGAREVFIQQQKTDQEYGFQNPFC